MNWSNYQSFLDSDAWALKREEAFHHHGRMCGCCGTHMNLQVHHKNYDHPWGKEPMDALEVLCKRCHTAHHRNAGDFGEEKVVKVVTPKGWLNKFNAKMAAKRKKKQRRLKKRRQKSAAKAERKAARIAQYNSTVVTSAQGTEGKRLVYDMRTGKVHAMS